MTHHFPRLGWMNPFKLDLSRLQLLLIYLPFLGLLIFTGLQTKAPIPTFTRDVFTIGRLPSYAGFVSNIGAFVWCSAFAVCWFSYLALRHHIAVIVRNFILCSGTLSLFLMLDDFFMLHERYYTAYFNITENVPYFVYGIIFLVYLFGFRKFIYQTRLGFFILTLLFFGLSGSLDFIESLLYDTAANDLPPDFYFLIEDGCKLLGLVSWCAYLTSVCIDQIRAVVSPRRDNTADVNTKNKALYSP